MTKDQDNLPFTLDSEISDGKTAYKLIDVLGFGTYSVVYLAKNLSNNTYYAFKCLSKYELTPEMQTVQYDEVLAMNQLGDHPNIVKLYHHFETSDWLFLVLEYCSGSDLFSWISESKDFSLLSEQDRILRAKPLFKQILDAVQYMHDNSVFHRDLKPENILLLDDDTVKVGDFGLATNDFISEEFYCGTKAYMSYECNHEDNNTYLADAADIWSLGLIFVNMIYRKLPWSEPDADACPNFALFLEKPVSYLAEKLNCSEEIAEFLSSKVFCEESSRISLKKFQEWFDCLSEEDEKISINSSSDPIPIACPQLDYSISSVNSLDSSLSESYVTDKVYWNKEFLEVHTETLKASKTMENLDLQSPNGDGVFLMSDLFEALPQA